MTIDQLPRQKVPVRRVHLETPASYLKRLCAANSIDRQWMETVVGRRRRAGGRGPAELGLVINELGGPEPHAFESAHTWARVGHPNTRGPWDRQSAARTACLSCTTGRSVTTFPHIRFAFCRRHGQWLGTFQRPAILDAELWKAEHRLRRLVRSGRVTHELYEGTWDAVRDHVYMIGEGALTDRFRRTVDQAGFTAGTDDRIALYPQTIRVLQQVTRPELFALASQGSRSNRDVRASLTASLDWAGDERWLLVNSLYKILQARISRAA